MFIARLYLAWAIASPSDRLNEPAITDRHTSNTSASPFRPTFHLLRSQPLSLSLSSPLIFRPVCANLHHSYVYALLEIFNRGVLHRVGHRHPPENRSACPARVPFSSLLGYSRCDILTRCTTTVSELHVFLFAEKEAVRCSREILLYVSLNLMRIEQGTMVRYSGGLKKFTVRVLIIH